MALSPRGAAPPELLFLRHFRVPSDGWKDSDNCDACTDQQQTMLLPYHEFDLSQECTCKMCTRQPPSLADSARHVIFNYSLHINRFQLESVTPYDLYVFATRSLEVPLKALLPPEEPMITIWYCTDIYSPFRFYRDFLGARTWLTQSEKFYHSQQAMVDDLVRHRNFIWCCHCDRGLFFLISCIEHADIVVGVADVANIGDVANMGEVDESDDEVEENIVL